MADETYYSLLEVSETASAAEIKAAYLRLIREVHPDKLANAPAYWQRQAEEKAKEINEAYTVLSNREKRRLYDAQLAAFRGSHTTTSGASTSQSSAQSATRSTPPRSRTSSGSQSTSGARNRSTHTPHSADRQHRAASTSTPPANASPRAGNQARMPGLSGGARFIAAYLLIAIGSSAAGAFWKTSSIDGGIFLFLLATVLFYGVVYLYEHWIGRLLAALGVIRPKHRIGASISLIMLVLLLGKLGFTQTKSSPSAPRHLSQSNTPNNTQLNEYVDTRDSQSQNVSNAPVPTHSPIATHSSNVSKSLSGEHPDDRLRDKYGNPAPLPTYHVSNGIDYCEDWFLNSNDKWQLYVHKCELSSSAASKSKDASSGLTAETISGKGQVPSTGIGNTSRRSAVGYEASSSTPVKAIRTPKIRSMTYGSSNLSSSDRASIESVCSGAKLLQGPAAYHQCLSTQLNELAQAPNAPDLSRLSSADRASIESVCSGAKLLQGPAAYHQCLSTQLDELAQDPNAPDLSRLSSADRASIESVCSSAKLLQGPASYNRCLKNQLAALRGQ